MRSSWLFPFSMFTSFKHNPYFSNKVSFTCLGTPNNGDVPSFLPPNKSLQIPGFDPSYPTTNLTTVLQSVNRSSAARRSLNSLSYSPGRQLFMTAFMLWMSGSTLNIFSIMMTGMALWSPVKSLLSTSSSFAKFSSDDVGLADSEILQAKAIFIGLNLVGLAMGAYKLSSMGLLPVHSSDWMHLLPNNQRPKIVHESFSM
eukprot:augustus_masked-scaffold_6-processed-gene-11.8-mRNA-1 protein AED:0.04 eAED:0.04 QI:0/0.25/0.2/0.4/0.75/0.6/5/1637/199